ncbi:MAG TPA: hypothetical protein VG122_17015 [Gemmata sp.]|nr:hypothetical protein [Gemmata sp.]
MDRGADGVIGPGVLPECHRQDEDKDAGKTNSKEPAWGCRGFFLGYVASVFLLLVAVSFTSLFVMLALGAVVHRRTPHSPVGMHGGVRRAPEPRDLKS